MKAARVAERALAVVRTDASSGDSATARAAFRDSDERMLRGWTARLWSAFGEVLVDSEPERVVDDAPQRGRDPTAENAIAGSSFITTVSDYAAVMAVDAPRTVFIFTPDELPGYDLGALPAQLRSATFFLLDERHVYTTADRAVHVPDVRDGRTADGRAARWLEHVQNELPVHVWLALGWDRGSLSGGFLKGHFDPRRLATVRKAFIAKRFTCLGPEILDTTDPARLAIPPASMALLGADGYLVEMVGGDGASGYIEERWFSSDVEALWTEVRRFYADPWSDDSLHVFKMSRRVLTEVRGGVVGQTWDLAEHETFVSTMRGITGSIAAPSSMIARSTEFSPVRAGQRVIIRLPDGEALVVPATAHE